MTLIFKWNLIRKIIVLENLLFLLSKTSNWAQRLKTEKTEVLIDEGASRWMDDQLYKMGARVDTKV